MGIDDRGMAAASLPRLEEPGGNLATIEAPVPDEFAIHDLRGWQLSLQAVGERGRPPASPNEETVRLRERGVVAEETGTIGMPSGVARGAPCGGDAPDAAPIARNGLQLDVPIVVLEVRDPPSVGRPQRHRLVPSVLNGPSYAAGLQVYDADVQVVVEVRDEREFKPVWGPRFWTTRLAPDRTFRVRERNEFFHPTREVREPDVIEEADSGREGDRPPVRTPSDLRDDVVDVRELLRLAPRRVHDEDVVAVPIAVRQECNPPPVRGPTGRRAVPWGVGDFAGHASARGRHVDVVILVALEVGLDREPLSVRRELGLDDGLLGAQQDFRLFPPKILHVNGPLLALVRGVGEPAAVPGHVEVPELPDFPQESPRRERDLPPHRSTAAREGSDG